MYALDMDHYNGVESLDKCSNPGRNLEKDYFPGQPRVSLDSSEVCISTIDRE